MRKYLTLALCLSFILTGFSQTDKPGSKDYGLLERMPDYYIKKYSEAEYDSFKFYLGKNKNTVVEGRKFEVTYEHTKIKDKSIIKPGRLQILRNYSNAIVKAGGQILMERSNHEYGNYQFKTPEGKEVWVQIRPQKNGDRYRLIIIEKDMMRQDIVIDADLIKSKIDIEGKIAIYGIQFDVAKSNIKSESKETLEAIAKFLNSNPSINCWVVGHTDSDGSFELNSKLSLARAKAVKNYLERIHGVDSNRLFAEGVGPLAPVATNATETGKKLNRRVELVKK